jgi:hypothetical protein
MVLMVLMVASITFSVLVARGMSMMFPLTEHSREHCERFMGLVSTIKSCSEDHPYSVRTTVSVSDVLGTYALGHTSVVMAAAAAAAADDADQCELEDSTEPSWYITL